jgi:hypothetical protein
MAYFNELPNIQYLSRFANQSSNEDYTLAKNIFRRAKLREDIANAVTAFQYYQIKDDERPDQIAERIYGDSELDWVVLISNNITSYPGQWTLSNESLYEYLIDKYGTEDNFTDIKYLETIEVRDEYQRIVVPEKLKVDPDIYQEFKTVANKNYPLFYDLKTFPVGDKYYPLEVNIDLGQYIEVWERDNQGIGEEYTGEQYQIADIRLQQKEEAPYLYPLYSRIDYSNLFIYGRSEIKKAFIPNSLNGWPSTWGGKLSIYHNDLSINTITVKSNIGFPINIANDSRLYAISTIDAIDTFSYSEGTTLSTESGVTYNVTNLSGSIDGVESGFKIRRNNNGKIISVSLTNNGRNFNLNENILIKGSSIGGVDITDDITITVTSIKHKAEFRFISIGEVQ